MNARDVVKRAAEGDHSAFEWLSRDERGHWEKDALETAARCAELGMSEEQALDELGMRLRLRALRALIVEAKGKRG